ncbi:tRNA (adenosine(37)-N6)-dimethylallyltransferase MiaA [Candidatus Saccharibacteria bacterium]|nr:tRNA (adenosine(37)-N6)-dimethylallyltransferase MiaA [Candidatus Saccharibacteria bacterium]
MATVGPLLVIIGETASGKSGLAMELARRLNGEIICADSWTVYPGFDIGTSKPTLADQSAVPHHLLDVADPSVGFSAVEFQRQAKKAIDAITAQGKLPIMVGGTGLYIDSVIFDFGFLPAPDPRLREELNRMTLAEVLERAELLGLDTAVVDTRNKRRVIRLIENNGQMPTKKTLRGNTLVIGLRAEPNELKARIEQRVDAMIATGLEREVANLGQQFGWDVEPMKGIGYASWKPYFEGNQDLQTTRQHIIKSTQDLAKRQRTWFKRNSSIHWINNREESSNIVDFVTTHLSTQ